jgi:hypothetical protein
MCNPVKKLNEYTNKFYYFCTHFFMNFNAIHH